MNWLSSHFWELFGGIGGTAAVALVGWLLNRFFKHRAVENTDATVTVRDSHVTGSPVAAGSNITQHNYFAPATPGTSAQVPVAPTKDKPRPNIRMTGARQASVLELGDSIFMEEDDLGYEGVLIRFTNEARRGDSTAGVPVRASVTYEHGETFELRSIGNWLESGDDVVRFRVEDSHSLVVGYLDGGKFITTERRRGPGGLRAEYHEIPNVQGVRVRLTDANSGDILYEGRLRLTLEPFGILPLD
jgi:hypothetical protein